MEKVVKENFDALWARIQEENTNQEILERDHVQQITNMISNYINKDMSSLLDKIIKKEIYSIETTITRSLSQNIDKAMNQLEKSVSSKLEATVARQIQVQFQTTAFEKSCKAMFEKIDGIFQNGFLNHTTSIQQQYDSTHFPLAIPLRETINSTSFIIKKKIIHVPLEKLQVTKKITQTFFILNLCSFVSFKLSSTMPRLVQTYFALACKICP
ncbi:hypothetical protein RYX36_011903 [Vicia faba]